MTSEAQSRNQTTGHIKNEYTVPQAECQIETYLPALTTDCSCSNARHIRSYLHLGFCARSQEIRKVLPSYFGLLCETTFPIYDVLLQSNCFLCTAAVKMGHYCSPRSKTGYPHFPQEETEVRKTHCIQSLTTSQV